MRIAAGEVDPASEGLAAECVCGRALAKGRRREITMGVEGAGRRVPGEQGKGVGLEMGAFSRVLRTWRRSQGTGRTGRLLAGVPVAGS